MPISQHDNLPAASYRLPPDIMASSTVYIGVYMAQPGSAVIVYTV